MAHPRGRTARLVCVGLATLVILGAAPASGNGPLVAGQLEIRGNRLTIHPDDAYQVVNVGERRRVRTCYGGADDDCGAIVAGDPRIAGLKVMAELRGPELPLPIPCETVPGGAFYLPAFQQPGEYLLENVRLVSTTTGQVLGAAQLSVVVLSVHQIVLASAEVRTLSLAELQARGITLTQENFQAFRFAVGFAFDDTEVVLDLPVLGEIETAADGLLLLRHGRLVVQLPQRLDEYHELYRLVQTTRFA